MIPSGAPDAGHGTAGCGVLTPGGFLSVLDPNFPWYDPIPPLRNSNVYSVPLYTTGM